MGDNKLDIGKGGFMIIGFSDYQVPIFKESAQRASKVIKYGEDNKYPDYLLDLVRRSPKHASIIGNKVKYIIGKGFKFKDDAKDTTSLDVVNKAGESLRAVAKKAILDTEIYGGFFLQIIWGKGKKIVDISNVDYHKVRSDKDNTEFYYLEKGWKPYTRESDDDVKTYPAFNPEEKTGTQILYYKEYSAGLDTYTLPEYIPALNYIESDAFVSEHTLNNSKNGFTASKMINFFNGEPETEQKKILIERAILEKYTGKKGNKLIISFNDDPAKAPQILDLGASDLSKENFENVDKLIKQNIYGVHQVTSPMLFGQHSDGQWQLGARSEIRDAYEIFKNIYVDDKQDALLEVINLVNSFRGVGEVEIIQKEPIGYALSEIAQYVPIEYIHEKIGLDPSLYPSLKDNPDPRIAKAQAAAAPAKPDTPTAIQASEQDDEALLKTFSEYGVPSNDFEVVKKKSSRIKLDFSLREEAIALADVKTTEASIIDLIGKDKRITPETIAATLKLPVPYVQRLVRELEQSGMIKTATETIGEDSQDVREVVENPEVRPITTDIFVKYSYDGPQDDRNRPFCARLMELSRLYSRSEIEQISQRVGYSVWERRGGFYHNPETDVTTPYCRHRWTQNIVVKKR